MMANVRPLKPLDLLTEDPSTNPRKPMQAVLLLDPRDGELRISLRHHIDGTPEDEYYGRIVRWNIPTLIDAAELTRRLNAGEIDHAISVIRQGYSEHLDGFGRRLGRLSPEAEEAAAEVEDWLENVVPELAGEHPGFWDAWDWLQDMSPADVPMNASDEELEAMAERIEEEARSENVVLYGTLEYLRHLRDHRG